MVIDGEWVDVEDWLIPKLDQIKSIRDEILQKIEEGELSDPEARNAMRYIDDIRWIDKTATEYWDSSAVYC